MTLSLPPASRLARWHIQRRVYDYRQQLLAAYISTDLIRIQRAKWGLIRWMRVLAANPALGPAEKFTWGPLTTIITFNIDPTLNPHILSAGWVQVIQQLEESLDE